MDEKERGRYYVDIIAATLERTNRRLWVLCMVLCVLLAASWGAFFWFESQFDYVTETTTQEVTQTADGESNNRFVGGDFYASDAEG